MSVNYSISDEDKNSSLINFLKDANLYNFISLECLLRSNKIQFLIIDKDVEKSKLDFILKNIKAHNTLVFAHNSLKRNIPKDFKIFYYPINISYFQNAIKVFTESNFSYRDICLLESGILINLKNLLEVNLTEKEHEIVKIFFNETIVERDKINKMVLKLQTNIDTKSLDAHLTRIRNKFAELEHNISIVSLGLNRLKII